LNVKPPHKTHLRGLALNGLTTLGDPGKDLLAILVEVKLGDDDVGGGDGNGNGLAVGLLAGDTLDVDDVLETVHGGDATGLSLAGTAGNDNLIVLAERDGADLLTDMLELRAIFFLLPTPGPSFVESVVVDLV
jgi:hypothetical protein